MLERDACPSRASPQFKKSGHLHTGKQKHRCTPCGRPFVGHADQRLIDEDHRSLVARVLRENISLHGICRAVGVSSRWLMDFMGACLAAVPKHLPGQRPHCPREVLLRRVEADERYSFVKRKATKPWLRLAMDRATRQIIAFHVGDRRRDSAQQLWANLPAIDREQATFSTDQYEVSRGVIPAARPKPSRR